MNDIFIPFGSAAEKITVNEKSPFYNLSSGLRGFKWKKMRDKDIPFIEDMLRDLEDDYTGLCGRFLAMVRPRDNLWMLCNKKRQIIAIILNSRSTVMPVLCGLKDIPVLKILKKQMRRKRIHSVQGYIEDVLILESQLQNYGRKIIDIFDFDFMTLNHLPAGQKSLCELPDVVICKPVLEDIQELLPLREGYEIEEVLPKGSVFHPEAAKVVLANFIKYGKILVARYNGKIIGHIVVNQTGFTKCQIGGVYVLPEYRGKGVAGVLTREFVTSLINEGWGLSLFVKKNNTPAKRLYSSLGFIYRWDYRITYY